MDMAAQFQKKKLRDKTELYCGEEKRMDLVSKVEISGHLGHRNHKVKEFKISVDRRKSASKTSALDMRRAEFRLLRELDEDGHLTNRDRDKAEVFNAFFASVFNTNDRPRRPQYPELEDHDCKKEQPPVDYEIVRDLLLQLDPDKFMGIDEIHPRILKELADVVIKPLSMIFEQYWHFRQVPADWKLVNLVPVFK
ncbi:rna-directed dna polymerase from mobile element jockey-like [Willisornis vidua]|uniref:Rna-directed dna polymerase from mobile element jockey-like n=1 Tax=Willisornis vidua TaxID=1566151 RepID=A0ABQ9DAL5_9PASS|nr:rna-directed dna polymerase from mobile element jockey-like [Willisornis vidua]